LLSTDKVAVKHVEALLAESADDFPSGDEVRTVMTNAYQMMKAGGALRTT